MGKKYIINPPESPKYILEICVDAKGEVKVYGDKIENFTPYTEPDMELLADEAHEIGFNEGYEQGIKQGRKEMREAVIKLADVSTRICAFDGGSIEYIFKTYKPETILGELAHFDKQKFDKDLSTLVEQYGYDGVTEVLRKMIESEKE